jgi:DNA-binding MarR family transcriptional regulator
MRARPRRDIISSVKELSDGTAADLLAAISAVRRSARRAVRQVSPIEPLPVAQGELLRLVARQPGMTVATAAAELRLAPNTVSTLVGRLAAQGLLCRERGAADGRMVSLSLTAKATERIAGWRDLRADLAERALARLRPRDRQALISATPALQRLARELELT